MSSTTKTAHFKAGVQVDGSLSGPTITGINTNATQTLQSLNDHKSAYNVEKASTVSRFSAAEAERAAMTQASQDAFSALQNQIDDNENDMEGKMAQEISDRLASEQSQFNKNASLDTEIATLNNLHASDDARLTSVESALQAVDTDLENKIQERIDAHNADLDNTLPRLAKLEDYMVIDESGSEPVIRFKSGVKVVITGEFEQGSV